MYSWAPHPATTFFVTLLVGTATRGLALADQASSPPPPANFAVPAGWIHTNTSAWNLTQRGQLARGALDVTLQFSPYNPIDGQLDELGDGGDSSFKSVAAQLDLINGTTTYQEAVVSGLNTIYTGDIPTALQPQQTRYFVMYALAAVDSYRAYHDISSLQVAEGLWNIAYPLVIQPEDAARGAHPLKTLPIRSSCNGVTTAGGIFTYYGNLPNDTSYTLAHGFLTSAWAGLSANLYELTSNTTYQTAAELSATFVRSQLYDGNIIVESLNTTDCTLGTGSFIPSYNTGFFIDALSVHASANSSWTPFLESLISTALRSSQWTDTDGVNVEYSSSSDPWQLNSRVYLFRGLYSAWNRTEPSSDMASFIEAYFNTQFYALQSSATNPGTNLYSSKWHGPPPSTSIVYGGQLDAAYVLNGALGFAVADPGNGTNSPSPSIIGSTVMVPSPTEPHVPVDQATGHSVPTGAIAGGVVGSCAVICLAIVITVAITRRQSRREARDRQKLEYAPVLDRHPVSQVGHITPFVSAAPLHQNNAAQVRKGAGHPHAPGAHGPTPNLPPSYMTGLSTQLPETDSDLTVVPALLARVNNILSRLPRGTDEGPPDYRTEA